MKSQTLVPAPALLRLATLLVLSLGITGCEIIGGIFRAGVWVGVLVILIVLGIIALLVSLLRS